MDENEVPLFTPTSYALTRARRGQESARLAFASFAGGVLAGLFAAVMAILVLLRLPGLLTCLHSMGVGAGLGVVVGIGGLIRLYTTYGTLFDVGSGSQFRMTKLECLGVIAGCAGVGSAVALAAKAEIFEVCPISQRLTAMVAVLVVAALGAGAAYVSQLKRRDNGTLPTAKETGNPYQPPAS